MISIDGKQIKLQIWDTVSILVLRRHLEASFSKMLMFNISQVIDGMWQSMYVILFFTGWSRIISIHYTVLLQRRCRRIVGVWHYKVIHNETESIIDHITPKGFINEIMCVLEDLDVLRHSNEFQCNMLEV